MIDGTPVTESLQCSTTFDFEDIKEGRGGRPYTHEEGDSHVLVDLIEYNKEAPNTLELVSQQLHWHTTLIPKMSMGLVWRRLLGPSKVVLVGKRLHQVRSIVKRKKTKPPSSVMPSIM